MKVTLTRFQWINNEEHEGGEVVDLPESEALDRIAMGQAKRFVAEEPIQPTKTKKEK